MSNFTLFLKEIDKKNINIDTFLKNFSHINICLVALMFLSIPFFSFNLYFFIILMILPAGLLFYSIINVIIFIFKAYTNAYSMKSTTTILIKGYYKYIFQEKSINKTSDYIISCFNINKKSFDINILKKINNNSLKIAIFSYIIFNIENFKYKQLINIENNISAQSQASKLQALIAQATLNNTNQSKTLFELDKHLAITKEEEVKVLIKDRKKIQKKIDLQNNILNFD